MRGGRAAIATAGALTLASCIDYGNELQITIRIPAETQEAVGSYPQQLLMRSWLRDGSPQQSQVVRRLAVLCEPGGPSVFHHESSGVGPKCVESTAFEAWLAPVQPTSESPCGERTPPDMVPECADCSSCAVECAPRPGQPRGSAVAFDDGCQNHDAITLELRF